ncbi:MAG: PaaI family thioesterase [bacterium]
MDDSRLKTRQAGLIRLFQGAPIIRCFGMSLHYNEHNQAVVDLPYNPNLDHALFQTHGGALATLLDTCGWFTVAAYFDHWISTVEFSTRLLEPIAKSDLRAIGSIVRLGKKIVFADMKVEVPGGPLIALGSGTFAVSALPLQLPGPA